MFVEIVQRNERLRESLPPQQTPPSSGRGLLRRSLPPVYPLAVTAAAVKPTAAAAAAALPLRTALITFPLHRLTPRQTWTWTCWCPRSPSSTRLRSSRALRGPRGGTSPLHNRDKETVVIASPSAETPPCKVEARDLCSSREKRERERERERGRGPHGRDSRGPIFQDIVATEGGFLRPPSWRVTLRLGVWTKSTCPLWGWDDGGAFS